MEELIKTIPLIPSGLKEASERGRLIPFVGAGASRIAGCPSWAEFADLSLGCIVDGNALSHGELSQLKPLSPRVKLSIARSLSAEHGISIDYPKILAPSGGYESNADGRRLYSALDRLGTTFVTTNYDGWLDYIPIERMSAVKPEPEQGEISRPRERTVIHKVDDFTPAALARQDTVVHLHGSVLDHKRMIVTTQDYIKHYANDHHQPDKENRVLTFLEYLFEHRQVLFIGYGLEELEILEYVVLKAKAVSKANAPQHYMLQGFFPHEMTLFKMLHRYYREECGIELIPYSRDKKDWRQILDVLDKWISEIPAGQPMMLEQQRDMEALLDGAE